MTYKDLFDYSVNDKVNDLIVVEGIVGAGKTELMYLLMEIGYMPLSEPVDTNPILDMFYQDKSMYSFALQVYFLNKRMKQLQGTYEGKHTMDRSLYGDAIFATMLNLGNEMTDIEYSVYMELYKTILKESPRPKLLIHLDISTQEAVKRINQRGREYELSAEYVYWENLRKQYMEFIDSYNLSPVLRIDVSNLDLKYNNDDRQYVLGLIKDKLKELSE